MLYRPIQKMGQKSASVIGLGAEHLVDQPQATVDEVVHTALEGGVNIIDIFMPQPSVREAIAKALGSKRKEVMLQAHIGSCWADNQQIRTRDLDQCKVDFEHYLTTFQTDYMDIGMMFYVDTDEDFDQAFNSPYVDYVLDLKKQGVIHGIGASCHNAKTAIRMVETGLMDVLMFSVNAAYDMLPGTYPLDDVFTDKVLDLPFDGMDPQRAQLYQLCEREGVAITTMKTLGGGWLLNPERTPFSAPLTVGQCIHYALNRPAVVSTMVGCRTGSEVEQALAYLEMSDADRDYTLIAQNMKDNLCGQCMYCNHCLPCPVHIDVAAVTKLLDLARHGYGVTDTLRAHYQALPVKADECLQCGSCSSNCPFGVAVEDNMRQAAELFG